MFFKFDLLFGGMPELKKKMGVIDLMPVVLDILRYDVERSCRNLGFELDEN